MGGAREENRGCHLTAVVLTDGSQGCIVYPTLDPKPFPAQPSHFLPSATPSPVAPACWPQGKILPHPSARSARHWSPQDGGPKGKMIEGRSGGSGRGTRRESWAPPDSGSAHRRIAGLYRVPDSRPEAVPCAALAFPSLRRSLTRRTCLLAPGKNSAAPKRTFSSALVSAGWRAQRENDRRKERGIWAGHSKRIVGPT